MIIQKTDLDFLQLWKGNMEYVRDLKVNQSALFRIINNNNL